MGVADLLSPQRIELNLPLQDKQAVLERLVKLEGYGEAILDLEAFRRDMMAREAQGGRPVWRCPTPNLQRYAIPVLRLSP